MRGSHGSALCGDARERDRNDRGSTTRILVMSAHAGARYWKDLCNGMERTGAVQLVYHYGFSDSLYRAPRGILGRAVHCCRTFVGFPLTCLWKLLPWNNGWDVVLAVSSPFFLPSLCAAVSRRPVIALMNDIYPEAFFVHGWISREGAAADALRAISRVAVAWSYRVVYITRSHQDIAQRELGAAKRVAVIPVGASPMFGSRPARSGRQLYLLYCGTLGRMHETATILQYFRECGPPVECRFGFRISGSEVSRLQTEIVRLQQLNGDRELKIEVGSFLSNDEWIKEMEAAHVGLVFQRPGGENVIFPSKAYSILLAGQAVLAITPSGSELARLVMENDCGWVVAPGDTSRLAEAVAEAMNPETLEKKQANAWALGHREFSVDTLARKWTNLITNDFGTTVHLIKQTNVI